MPRERALFTQRRKEAYEALHPETKFKSTLHKGSGRQVGDEEEGAPRFTADTDACLPPDRSGVINPEWDNNGTLSYPFMALRRLKWNGRRRAWR